jgi:hypothetical protein
LRKTKRDGISKQMAAAKRKRSWKNMAMAEMERRIT